MDGVFELEVRDVRVEVWEQDSLGEIDVILNSWGESMSTNLTPEQADRVAVALIQATQVTSFQEGLRESLKRLGWAESDEDCIYLGLALIRSAR